MKRQDPAAADFDVVYLQGPPSADGFVPVVRVRPEGTSRRLLQPLREGQSPLASGDIVRLRPRSGQPGYDVQVLCRAGEPVAHDGPPRVTSDDYRAGWDAIFAKSATVPTEELN